MVDGFGESTPRNLREDFAPPVHTRDQCALGGGERKVDGRLFTIAQSDGKRPCIAHRNGYSAEHLLAVLLLRMPDASLFRREKCEVDAECTFDAIASFVTPLVRSDVGRESAEIHEYSLLVFGLLVYWFHG